ncbi:electron transport complex subunit E [Mariprofundus ferrooxydans]|uniref:electron transport complex subunit E n=1 Tax=Mariprofundus ferrooxydans TaxID=314344 RepID=UPI00037A1C3E|nr:electron transport complex subunit E [Mariprofundus ferrooxydans]
MADYRQIIRDGIWDNNAIFVQMLALCPLLAVTSTATNGLGMGMATTAVLLSSNLVVSALRNIISQEVRIPVFILLIATIVTLIDLGMNAYMHDLHKVLGLFIPLIVTNCVILARAESFASKQSLPAAALDGLMMGAGFTLALVLLGGVREIIGSGTLFANASLLLGSSFSFLDMRLLDHYRGFLLMILPSGGFLALGFLLAAKSWLDHRQADRAAALARSARVAAINAMDDEDDIAGGDRT